MLLLAFELPVLSVPLAQRNVPLLSCLARKTFPESDVERVIVPKVAVF